MDYYQLYLQKREKAKHRFGSNFVIDFFPSFDEWLADQRITAAQEWAERENETWAK